MLWVEVVKHWRKQRERAEEIERLRETRTRLGTQGERERRESHDLVTSSGITSERGPRMVRMHFALWRMVGKLDRRERGGVLVREHAEGFVM